MIGKIYAGQGRMDDAARIEAAVRAGASGDITLPASETRSDHVVWYDKTAGGTYLPTPVIYGNALYVLNDKGIFSRRNPETGERLYQARVSPDEAGEPLGVHLPILRGSSPGRHSSAGLRQGAEPTRSAPIVSLAETSRVARPNSSGQVAFEPGRVCPPSIVTRAAAIPVPRSSWPSTGMRVPSSARSGSGSTARAAQPPSCPQRARVADAERMPRRPS